MINNLRISIASNLKYSGNNYFLFKQVIRVFTVTLLMNSSFSIGAESSAVILKQMNYKQIMDDARAYFESGKLDESIREYSKIPQSSDFWIESIEEKGWAYLRKGESDKALNSVTTLTSDFLSPQVGPEPYFLKALVDYKHCDIKGIFQDFDLFKKRFKVRSEEISKLTSAHSNLGTEKALKVLKNKKANLNQLTADDFGIEIQYLPRFFYRDKKIRSLLKSSVSDSLILSELSQLAKKEKSEIDSVLQKMHLLESQVVQQVFAYNEDMKKAKSAQFKSVEENNLVFPLKSDGELWVDEIDHIESATSNCPVDPLSI